MSILLRFGFAASLSLFVLRVAGAQTLTDTSVGYQIDAQHTGAVTVPGLSASNIQKNWSVNLGASISYPLVAQGKVYVTVGDDSTSNVQLDALDAATGKVAWSVPLQTTYRAAEATYDNGKVFVVDNNFTSSTMIAYDATSGAKLWQQPLSGQYAFSSPPTAGNGLVYTGGAGSGGTLYALNQNTGATVWTAGVANGDNSAPVVTKDGVYVSYAGAQTYKFDPLTGKSLWHYDSGIEGGGGKTAVLYNGNLYTRENIYYNGSFASKDGLILNSATGQFSTGFGPQFQSVTAPAFDNGRGFFVTNGTLSAQNLSATSTFWSHSITNDPFVTAPVVINGDVYEGTGSGKVYIYDETTGLYLKTLNAGSTIFGPDEQNVSQPLTGFGAGAGEFFVPAGNTLVAFGAAVPEPSVLACLLAGGIVTFLFKRRRK